MMDKKFEYLSTSKELVGILLNKIINITLRNIYIFLGCNLNKSRIARLEAYKYILVEPIMAGNHNAT